MAWKPVSGLLRLLSLAAVSIAPAACADSTAGPPVNLGPDLLGCVPFTCEEIRSTCGQYDDGCGGTIACGMDCQSDVSIQRCDNPRFTWLHPRPQGGSIRALWSNGPDDVWAAGESGTLLRFDGARWNCVDSGLDRTFDGLWSDGQTVFLSAAAEDGRPSVLLRSRGAHAAGGFDVAERPETMLGVWGTSANDLWAGDTRGRVWRSDGKTWTVALDHPQDHGPCRPPTTAGPRCGEAGRPTYG